MKLKSHVQINHKGCKVPKEPYKIIDSSLILNDTPVNSNDKVLTKDGPSILDIWEGTKKVQDTSNKINAETESKNKVEMEAFSLFTNTSS